MPMRKTFLKFLADKEPKMVWSPKEELIRARINTPWGATPALKLREESCLTDPTMIEWLSYAMEEVFLWACRGRTTTLLPWLSCLPEALFLSRKKETSLTDMDIFSVSIPVFQSELLGRKFHIFWHVTERSPSYGNAKKKSRAASRGNELTRSMELHDAEFSPCPLPLMNESDRTKARYFSI